MSDKRGEVVEQSPSFHHYQARLLVVVISRRQYVDVVTWNNEISSNVYHDVVLARQATCRQRSSPSHHRLKLSRRRRRRRRIMIKVINLFRSMIIKDERFSSLIMKKTFSFIDRCSGVRKVYLSHRTSTEAFLPIGDLFEISFASFLFLLMHRTEMIKVS